MTKFRCAEHNKSQSIKTSRILKRGQNTQRNDMVCVAHQCMSLVVSAPENLRVDINCMTIKSRSSFFSMAVACIHLETTHALPPIVDYKDRVSRVPID